VHPPRRLTACRREGSWILAVLPQQFAGKKAGCKPLSFPLSSPRLTNNKRHDETRREYAMNKIAPAVRPYRLAVMICLSLMLAACASQSVVETLGLESTKAKRLPRKRLPVQRIITRRHALATASEGYAGNVI
jgi:hypothetical protein